jgi:hypothetical protein
MSEEVENASVTVPRAIMLGVFINGTLGFGMLLATLFCLGNVDDILSAPYLYPFIEIFVASTGSVSGSTAMASLIVLLSFCTTIGLMASSSRMTWSFARDHGLPGWEALSKVCLIYLLKSMLVAKIDLGRSKNFNSLDSSFDNNNHSSIGQSHQHRFGHGIKRPSFPVYQQLVRIISNTINASPEASIARKYTHSDAR